MVARFNNTQKWFYEDLPGDTRSRAKYKVYSTYCQAGHFYSFILQIKLGGRPKLKLFRHFFNIWFLHHPHLKALNERISEWAYFSDLANLGWSFVLSRISRGKIKTLKIPERFSKKYVLNPLCLIFLWNSLINLKCLVVV